MAVFSPDFENIRRMKVQPTEGEWALLNALRKLDNSFEIYFQSFLNGDEPDVVIMKKGKGVLIIEVKDWNLGAYALGGSVNRWKVVKRNKEQYIYSPFNQVEEYKKNIYNLHSIQFRETVNKNKSAFSIIKTAVYFHKTTRSEWNTFVSRANDAKYKLKYISVVTKGQLDILVEHIQNTFGRNNYLFRDELYQSLKRYLHPPFHRKEEGKEINYNKAQKAAIISKAGARQKYKGVAGSGKTLVLAKRAVNAHLRTNQKVLILTFNLSLINYIHDRISDVREDFHWRYFEIVNYHQFFKTQARNYSVRKPKIGEWEDTSFFETVKDDIKKYDAIFVDEYQDYRTEWATIITKYFLESNGEYVIFGDEKQNIYDRSLDEDKTPVAVGISGRWNKSLKVTYRLSTQIADLAKQFQSQFFSEKYNIDELEAKAGQQLIFGLNIRSKMEYKYFSQSRTNSTVFNHIWQIITSNSIHPSDVGILGIAVEPVRELDKMIRDRKGEKTTTMFEPEEKYQTLFNQYTDNEGETNWYKLNKELESIRKPKKVHFWMKTGTVKLSTIHSFKGWELHSTFLLITPPKNDEQEEVMHELVYTAITRARENLFIINMGYPKYNDFFYTNI